ncbi:hypothetical protein [Chitinimonas lacunae]|uniref:Uncharacterized protein n=1 Tax=Chitinimonas lacunae TaxID=1963018 RepID=A0ABV8MPE2_9NEIS
MQINTWLACWAGLLLSAVGAAVPAHDRAADQPFVHSTIREADLTGDGRPERMVLTAKALSWYAPVAWSLTVADRGRIIYRRDRAAATEGEYVEEMFSVKSKDCPDYLSCKRHYYLHQLGESWALPANPDFLHGTMGEVLDRQIDEEMTRLAIPAKRRAAIRAEVRHRVGQAGTLVLVQPNTPFHSDAALIWVPSLAQFITYYDD